LNKCVGLEAVMRLVERSYGGCIFVGVIYDVLETVEEFGDKKASY